MITKSTLLRRTSTLFSGQLMAQILGVLTIPIISRLYAPEEFGLMSTIWALVIAANVFSCGGYEPLIIIEKEDDDAGAIAAVSVKLSIVWAAIFACGAIIFGEVFRLHILSMGAFVFFILFFSLLGSGMRKVEENWAIRNKMYRLVSFATLLGAISSAAVKVIGGLVFTPSGAVLVCGNLVGVGATVIVIKAYLSKRNQGYSNLINTGMVDNKSLLKKHLEFPKKGLPSSALNNMQQQLPILIFGLLFGIEVAGLIGIIFACAKRPVSTLSSALNSVLLERYSEDRRLRRKNNVVLHTQSIVLILFVPFSMIYIFAEFLVSVVLGAQWSDAALVLQVLLPWLFMLVANVPSVAFLKASKNLNFLLGYSIGSFIVRFGVTLLSFMFTSDYVICLLSFSILSVLSNVYLVLSVGRLSNYGD